MTPEAHLYEKLTHCSHEMRNPLSAMLQSADSIISLAKSSARQPWTPDKEAVSEILDAAETIVLCAQHQKRIVDDILTLSKLDASLLEMSPEKAQLPPLLDKALKMFEAEIERVGVNTSVIIEPSWRELDVDWVVLDASRVLQVIINLVTNSLKFVQSSKKREITIALGASHQRPSGKHHGVCFVPRARGQDEKPYLSLGNEQSEEIYVQIAVTDTGRGLSEEEQKLLFHRFSQGSPKTYKQVSQALQTHYLAASKGLLTNITKTVWRQRSGSIHLSPAMRASGRPDRRLVEGRADHVYFFREGTTTAARLGAIERKRKSFEAKVYIESLYQS